MFTRKIKTATVVASLFLASWVVNAPAAVAQEAGPVTVSFSGITRPTGALMVGIYDSEAAFAGGNPVDGFKLDVTGPEASKTVTGLKPGVYAIKVFHDVDGDGRMGTNAFGIPLEPYAASNNAPSRMGPPAWADARFEVTADGAVQTITID
jgi:uncharacterized protein (DUF2141 family)